MVDAVMDDAQDTWRQLLGGRYQDTKAVLFRDAINSACGFAQSATGPFYCPADRKVYLDLGFFDELDRRLGAPGDFAQAYVLAHELGHHVQTLTGVEAPGARASSRRARARATRCRSGWSSRPIATPASGAITPTRAAGASSSIPTTPRKASTPRRRSATTACSGCRAAASRPERFTHGTSQQRVEWFKRGMESGDPKACNTFQ